MLAVEFEAPWVVDAGFEVPDVGTGDKSDFVSLVMVGMVIGATEEVAWDELVLLVTLALLALGGSKETGWLLVLSAITKMEPLAISETVWLTPAAPEMVTGAPPRVKLCP